MYVLWKLPALEISRLPELLGGCLRRAVIALGIEHVHRCGDRHDPERMIHGRCGHDMELGTLRADIGFSSLPCRLST